MVMAIIKDIRDTKRMRKSPRTRAVRRAKTGEKKSQRMTQKQNPMRETRAIRTIRTIVPLTPKATSLTPQPHQMMKRPRKAKCPRAKAKKDVTGASNPHLADPEESKKGEGIKDSAKIVGTVDPGRNIRKPGDPEHPEKMDKSEKGKPSNVNR